jgi:isocitrate/isopropylmalate dehydrogenase
MTTHRYRLGVMLGDGIGPEIVPASVRLDTRRGDPTAADAAARVEDGVRAAVRGGVSTRDLGGTASTDEFTEAAVQRIGAGGTSGGERG